MPAAPPTGTVTFLFTDIEGSSRLWEQQPDAMRPALARHDALIRSSVEQHHGYVVKTTGDGIHAAFATAPQALAAVLSAQRALWDEPWGPQIPISVRMGLHTGSAEGRDGDYYGGALNRAARLMAAGHGGQVLLSAATQELARDHLPDGASLRDLGEHRFKDLGRSEQVFQLLHPALPAEFPPLKSLDNPALPNNLPQQTTSFIGREKQVEEVKDLLGRTRLLTLTGAGGSGKTRLSLQAAADLLDGEGDGVWLVELAALADPALVPQAVADVLGVKEQSGKAIQASLVEWLRPKRLLLILDNCEHLVSACASLAAGLLRACPDVHLLASSREALNVSGEQAYRVPSLSLPDPKQTQTAESLSRYEAVRLFTARAKAVRPAFIVTDANAPAVAGICRRLDGIPLAIEMAAARVRALSVEEINVRMDRQFHLLTGGTRTALPRQQTLRALIDWSYDLLTGNEKALLRRLSVFAGGWTLSAAERVCSGEGVEDSEVLDLLTGLVDKSLVVYEEGDDDVGRYRLLETVRQYARDRLKESGETEAVCSRSASWFLGLAEEAEPHLTGAEQASWLRRLETEHDNLRASLSWHEQTSEQSAGDAEDGLRFAGALWRFWWVRGHYSEGRQWLGQALARATTEAGGRDGATGREASSGRAKALNGAGYLASQQGDAAAARALLEESLTLHRRLGDQWGIAFSINTLGDIAIGQGDHVGGRALLEKGLTLRRQVGDRWGIAYSLSILGDVATFQGDLARARALYEESLAIRRQMGHQTGIAYALFGLGRVARIQDDLAGARTLYEEGLTLWRQVGHQSGIADSLISLGDVAIRQGDLARAQALYEESLEFFRQVGDRGSVAFSLTRLGDLASLKGDYAAAWTLLAEGLTLHRQLGDQQGIAECLDGMAGVARGQSQQSRAARLEGASSALRESIGSFRPPLDQENMEKTMASVREALGEEAFAAAWEAGRAMTWEQAVEYALSTAGGDPA